MDINFQFDNILIKMEKETPNLGFKLLNIIIHIKMCDICRSTLLDVDRQNVNVDRIKFVWKKLSKKNFKDPILMQNLILAPFGQKMLSRNS